MSAAGDRFRRVASNLDAVPSDSVRSGAKLLQAHLLAALASATGGDSRLSGMSRRGSGKAAGVNVRVSAGSSLATAEVTPKQAGVWTIVEDGTRNRPQGGSSPARRPWARTVARTMPVVEAALERRWRSAVRY